MQVSELLSVLHVFLPATLNLYCEVQKHCRYTFGAFVCCTGMKQDLWFCKSSIFRVYVKETNSVVYDVWSSPFSVMMCDFCATLFHAVVPGL